MDDPVQFFGFDAGFDMRTNTIQDVGIEADLPPSSARVLLLLDEFVDDVESRVYPNLKMRQEIDIRSIDRQESGSRNILVKRKILV